MPTEEVFTMPDNRYVNGKVCSTMPLLYNGKKINNFYLVFKNGKIVDFKAKENNGLLETLINSDKGTRSIGEVALVPYSSPISASKTLFYETLFDENASCHLAIGASYPMNIKDGAKMNDATLLKNGANVSNYHVDFMFGSSDMDIVGVKYNGQKVQVFKKGEFVLKL
jgi:aminopeptidase